MKYLVGNGVIYDTENWEERMGKITIESYAQEIGFKIVDVTYNHTEPLSIKDFINNKFDYTLYEKRIGVFKAKKELADLMIWFSETDYIPNKIIRGNWKQIDQRWLDYKIEYLIKHSRKEELELMIKKSR